MNTRVASETFVFFGIVGSGKGTQIKLLSEYLKKSNERDIVYAYPGAEYRALIESGSYTGGMVKDSLMRGELQPDFLTNAVFADILIKNLTSEKHLIADGYPRTLNQSETFEAMMKFYKRENIKIIYIELSKEEAMKRNLLRGRLDDTKEGLERRFEEYVNNVVPAIKYFDGRENYTIYKINGEQTIEKVHQDIISALGY